MAIRAYIEPAAFDPETITLMSEAFTAAVKELQDRGQP